MNIYKKNARSDYQDKLYKFHSSQSYHSSSCKTHALNQRDLGSIPGPVNESYVVVKVAQAQITFQIFRFSFFSIIPPSFRIHTRLQSQSSETCVKRNTDIMKTRLRCKTVTVPWIWTLVDPRLKELFGTEPALNGKNVWSLALPL
jgi:hypothetical protein